MTHSPETAPTRTRIPLARLFLDHPDSVDEGYFEHMRFALGFAFWLGIAALSAFVHALLPFACKTTGSRIIRKLHARIENRGAAQ